MWVLLLIFPFFGKEILFNIFGKEILDYQNPGLV